MGRGETLEQLRGLGANWAVGSAMSDSDLEQVHHRAIVMLPGIDEKRHVQQELGESLLLRRSEPIERAAPRRLLVRDRRKQLVNELTPGTWTGDAGGWRE